ncbi:MAG TPA: dTDP-4-dehydrorhamnose reductase [Blastocatellia bacterium]|nr:dTDP-4-dehydrorhamnose reductase [Blastocatellia bacterium]
MKIAITGAAGQLGSDLVSALRARGQEVTPLTRAELDVTDAGRMRAVLAKARPEIVINCTAENRVDDCEELLAEAFTLNAIVPGRMAAMTRELGAALLHLSTDYVFDGGQRVPYVESDTPSPLSAYGASKLAGEQLVRQRNPRHYIVRVSGLYGAAGSRGKGGNFVEAILRRARAEGRLRVVNDQTTAPTYTRDLAAGIARLIESSPAPGLYHLAADGEATWYDFAREIVRQTGVEAEVIPIGSAELNQRARRPACSVLRSETLAPLRHWRPALRAYLVEKAYLTSANEREMASREQ